MSRLKSVECVVAVLLLLKSANCSFVQYLILMRLRVSTRFILGLDFTMLPLPVREAGLHACPYNDDFEKNPVGNNL